MSTARSGIRFFSAKDRIPGALDGEQIAIIGYGHVGRPIAMNLRDSGVANLLIGNIDDDYAQQARDDAFTVLPIAEAVRQASIILILIPDEIAPEVFPEIATNLQAGSAILFASGYTLAFDLIKPPPGIDVLLMAPRMGGEHARHRYLSKRGFYAYLAVEQEASGKAWRRLLGLADAVGILWAGAIELSSRDEAILDLYIEQSLGALLGSAVMTAFATGLEAGIPAEALIMEMYMSEEMETVWRAFREKGFFVSSHDHGPTAMFGGYMRSMEFLSSGLNDTFAHILDDIRSGGFARKFEEERRNGYPQLTMAQSMTETDSPMAAAESRLRKTIIGTLNR